ncbi:class I SAM-dependent methyltransferase [Candidatus Babeliales bacterium]|nr:class I SAM-dependent methyltransferase [Candidatus Babeliales bacterium]
MLYTRYTSLYKQGQIHTGFSNRLPDYAVRFWLGQLEKVIFGAKRGRFLDVGAGDGRLTRLLAEFFKQGVAIEVQGNKHSWDRVRQACPNVMLREGLLQDLVPALEQEKPFDFILLAEVFEHIPLEDVDNFLSALPKVLASDGVIFLTTPNFVVQGPAEKSPRWYRHQPYGHYKHYSFEEVKTLLAKHGLEIVEGWFECHQLKAKVYNRFYYPVARLDAKLLHSKKVPGVLRWLYKVISYPFLPLINGFFNGLGWLVNRYEARYNNEKNAETMILKIQKSL